MKLSSIMLWFVFFNPQSSGKTFSVIIYSRCADSLLWIYQASLPLIFPGSKSIAVAVAYIKDHLLLIQWRLNFISGA